MIATRHRRARGPRGRDHRGPDRRRRGLRGDRAARRRRAAAADRRPGQPPHRAGCEGRRLVALRVRPGGGAPDLPASAGRQRLRPQAGAGAALGAGRRSARSAASEAGTWRRSARWRASAGRRPSGWCSSCGTGSTMSRWSRRPSGRPAATRRSAPWWVWVTPRARRRMRSARRLPADRRRRHPNSSGGRSSVSPHVEEADPRCPWPRRPPSGTAPAAAPPTGSWFPSPTSDPPTAAPTVGRGTSSSPTAGRCVGWPASNWPADWVRSEGREDVVFVCRSSLGGGLIVSAMISGHQRQALTQDIRNGTTAGHHARSPARGNRRRCRAPAVAAGRVRRPGAGEGVAPDRDRRGQGAR